MNKKTNRSSINKKIGKRFKELIFEYEGQCDVFATKVGYSAEHISNICTGKSRLTEDFAKRCSERWGIREEYILCKCDYKTEEEFYKSIDNEDHSFFIKQKDYLETLGFKINIKIELQCHKLSLFKAINIIKDYLTDESYNNFINEDDYKNDNSTLLENGYLQPSKEYCKKHFLERITVQLKKPLSQELTEKIFSNYDRKQTFLESDVPFDSIDTFFLPVQESMLLSNCEYLVSYSTYYNNKHIGDFSLNTIQSLFKTIDSYTKCTINNFIESHK